eukprot:5181720-Lingulodinium_polyedra.AAC.1
MELGLIAELTTAWAARLVTAFPQKHFSATPMGLAPRPFACRLEAMASTTYAKRWRRGARQKRPLQL